MNIRLFAAVFALGALTACSNQQIFTRTVERNAPPRPGIYTDRFLYGKPHGPVDVVFVADNSESFEVGLDDFRRHYENFLALWDRPVAHALDFRVQLATTPNGQMPSAFASRDGREPHLRELFDADSGAESWMPGLFSHRRDRERGYLNPLESAQRVLKNKDFILRTSVPAFLVFIMGDDVDPASAEETLVAEAERLKAFLEVTRGLDKVHVATLTRNPPDSSADSPSCRKFRPSSRALRQISRIPWRSQLHYDLCTGNWATFEEKVFERALEFRTKLVLSVKPEQPETMSLRGASRLFRYGDDYTYDAAANEIVFRDGHGLLEGDLIEVSYFTTPVQPETGGNPTPPGAPR